MLNFKTFLIESINPDQLKKTIERFNVIEGIKSAGYYLKGGAPAFALGLYNLINKKGDLFILSDKETDILHVVVKIGDMYWDINGGNDLKRKEEYITVVGDSEWKPATYEEIVKTMKNPSEILDVYEKLKNIYVEKQY